MRTKKLGWTELELTTVGLGTWAMGGGEWRFGWGSQEDQESIATVRKALDLGVNWIDTAAVYGLGRSEMVVGEAVRGLPQRPILATKCGLVWDESREVSNRLKRKSVLAEVDDSLWRLGVDCIDLYQVHWPNPDEDLEEAWGAVADAVKAGKIRYAGVSNFNVAQMERVQSIHPIASLQPPYSMLRRGIEDDILSYCAEENIGVIAYSPMQKGLLTEKFSREWALALAADDHRSRDPMFTDPQLRVNLRLVDGLRSIASERGMKVSQLAIAWVLHREEVTSAIVGARRPAQIEETVRAGDWILELSEIDAIEALLKEREAALK
ncbi:MAG: aldo/keto reductase [Anaerolineales bacterium]|nr:aldo/keto reductase [Anaerolineales bacterium]